MFGEKQTQKEPTLGHLREATVEKKNLENLETLEQGLQAQNSTLMNRQGWRDCVRANLIGG